MKEKIVKIFFRILITLTLFSFWAGFALLVINPLFYKNVPGYVIGRICVWEIVALLIAVIVAHFLIKRWGSPQIVDGKLIINQKFGIYFLIYFGIALTVAIWQFWIFSLNF